jgi:hypothetical protein
MKMAKKKMAMEDIDFDNESIEEEEMPSKKLTKGEFEESAEIDHKAEINTLRHTADALQAEIEEAEEKAREMEVLFAAIREKRQRLRTINKVLYALTGERGETRPRRPNGANRQTIGGFLAKHPKSSVKDISLSTGIPIPSVRATLKGGGFHQDDNHRWTLA